MKTASRSFWIIILVILAVSGLAIWLVVVPQTRQLFNTRHQLKESEKEIDLLTQRKNKLMELENNSLELAEFYQLVTDYLPQKQAEGSFIVETEKIFQDRALDGDVMKITGPVKKGATPAQTTGEEEAIAPAATATTTISTTTTAPAGASAVSPATGIAQTGFSFTFKGDFGSFLDFLKAWQGIRRLFAFSAIEIRSIEEGKISGKLDGAIFYKTATSLADTLENLTVNFQKMEELKARPFHSIPVSPSEPGYGRENPFVSY